MLLFPKEVLSKGWRGVDFSDANKYNNDHGEDSLLSHSAPPLKAKLVYARRTQSTSL